MFLEAYLKNM